MLILLRPSMSTLCTVYPPICGATTRARAPGLSTNGGWSSLFQVIGCLDQLSHLGQADSVSTDRAAHFLSFWSLRQLLVVKPWYALRSLGCFGFAWNPASPGCICCPP